MVATFKPGFELSETTRAKSFGSIIIVSYVAILFILMCSIGYFALRSSENNLQDIFPCTFIRDMPGDLQDNWTKSKYCPPAHNIFFLKTHKCASSTVQNILMRFGDEHNLSFILPEDSNYIGHPQHFSSSMISEQISHASHFNILCHHLRLNAEAVKQVMPQTTMYISILRNPVSLFKSMYDYYNMSDFYSETIEDFVEDENSLKRLSSSRMYGKLGKNQMLFDFGYDSDIWKNESLIHKAISEIDKTFHLVMIQELFDESLVLLKHKLCWTTPDIVYLKHNMRTQNLDMQKNSNLYKKIERFNAADKMLYDYFLRKLNNIIDSFGRDRMAKEVDDLRLWNNVWFHHCVKKMAQLTENVPTETKALNSKVYSFVLNDQPIAELCNHLAMEELQYTDKLRTKQKLIYGV